LGLFESPPGNSNHTERGLKRGANQADDSGRSKKLCVQEKNSDILTTVEKVFGSPSQVIVPTFASQPVLEPIFRLLNVYATTTSLPKSRWDFMEVISP